MKINPHHKYSNLLFAKITNNSLDEFYNLHINLEYTLNKTEIHHQRIIRLGIAMKLHEQK